MTSQFLAHDIECEEARRRRAYPDPLTHGAPYTIGVGHCGPEVKTDTVWTDAQIDAALASDIANCKRRLDATEPWWGGLDDIRQDVLVQMVFQMGIGGMEGFPHALACMRAKDWQGAHDGMLNSKWAKVQTPARAKREATQMLTGMRVWA